VTESEVMKEDCDVSLCGWQCCNIVNCEFISNIRVGKNHDFKKKSDFFYL